MTVKRNTCILINGMRSFDQSLSEIEAKTLMGWLNDREVMMENPAQMEPYTGIPEAEWEDVPREMPPLVLNSLDEMGPVIVPVPAPDMAQS